MLTRTQRGVKWLWSISVRTLHNSSPSNDGQQSYHGLNQKPGETTTSTLQQKAVLLSRQFFIVSCLRCRREACYQGRLAQTGD